LQRDKHRINNSSPLAVSEGDASRLSIFLASSSNSEATNFSIAGVSLMITFLSNDTVAKISLLRKAGVLHDHLDAPAVSQHRFNGFLTLQFTSFIKPLFTPYPYPLLNAFINA
jgi:hypothetical protein